MALIVEDGSGVSNANTYATVEATQAYALARGLDLSDVVAEIEQLLIVAMDYLESLRAEYQGNKVSKSQALQWPRTDVYVDNFAIDSDEIPTCLVQAQMRLACYAYDNDGVLTEVSDGRVVIEDTVANVTTTKYADHGDSNPQPKFPEADRLIAPLLQSASFGGAGIALRV